MTPEERREAVSAVAAGTRAMMASDFFPMVREVLDHDKSLLDRAREVLRAIEWHGGGVEESCCPDCSISEGQPHPPDCKLAALLADLGPAPKEG